MQQPAEDNVPDPVATTTQAIAELHARSEGRVSAHQRRVERVTNFLGRPQFLYIALGFALVWVGTNLYLKFRRGSAFDEPPFFWLQGMIACSALVVTVVVLATQNRQTRMAERREQLDLQISLLIEQKVTKLISLVEELRRDMPNVNNRRDLEAEHMMEAADPHKVVEELNRVLGDAVQDAGEDPLSFEEREERRKRLAAESSRG